MTVTAFSSIASGLATLAFGVMLIWPPITQAADPQPYSVAIAGTGDLELDGLLKDSCTLISLKETAPVGSFALVARARGDIERFMLALSSLGYYDGKVMVRIAHRPLDDPGLYDTIDYAPADPPTPVEITVIRGQQYQLQAVNLEGNVPESAKLWLELTLDTPARAAKLQQAREKLLLALQEQGYALARVDEPIARLLPESHGVAVTYHVDIGKLAQLGALTFDRLTQVNPEFAKRHLGVTQGDAFKPSRLEKSRKNLQNTGVFASVRTELDKMLTNQQQLPITYKVSERLRHTTRIGAAYSTDLGASVTSYWQHHNLLGSGEQLSINAGITQLGGNSTTGAGYNFGVGYLKPDFLATGQNLQTNIGAVKQNLITYDQEAVLAETTLSRALTQWWTASLGLRGEQATISQADETHDYTLASLPVGVKYDGTDNVLEPTRGLVIAPSITPLLAFSQGGSRAFLVMQVSASNYLDLHSRGRSVLAMRGLLGNISGAGRFDLPPDQRFYGGGSATVRGYRYQSIGPAFADGTPQGGKAIATASLEFRQRILEQYGMVAFADVGQVSPSALFASGSWRLGAGIGARYYSSFGPLRLDVAFPVNQQSNSGDFEIYLGLGQAF